LAESSWQTNPNRGESSQGVFVTRKVDVMQAIETVYRGYRFRSRLEARWAVFFDAMKIEWRYEFEGYLFKDGTMYLPDFFLPKFGWIEIKGKYPTGEENHKITMLCIESNTMAYLFFGDIPTQKQLDTFDFRESSYAFFPPNGAEDFPYVWCECPICGSIGIQFDGRSARNKHKEECPVIEEYKLGNDKNYNSSSDRLLHAYNLARSARFEFDEYRG
jgi:hypothetical protein